MEAAGNDARRNATRGVERERKEEGSDEELELEVEAPIVPEVAASGEEQGGQEAEESEDEEEEEEEEILVVLELCDFKNHPVLGDYASLTLEGIDTAAPKLKIGEFELHGELEETVGTSFFYDTTDRTPANEYKYVGQTVRRVKFTIEPPEPPPYPLG